MAPALYYWNVRGLINHTRLLLEHVGEKYEMHYFPLQPTGDDKDWFAEKYQQGLPFPNLPFLKDGDVVLTQSDAIIRYFARKYDLVAKTEEELQQQDVLGGVLWDMRRAFGKLLYADTDFETDKAEYKKNGVGPTLQQLDEYLTNKDYLLGQRLTYTDFVLFEMLDLNLILLPDFLDGFANLKKFHQRILNLKGVKDYLTSDRLPPKQSKFRIPHV